MSGETFWPARIRHHAFQASSYIVWASSPPCLESREITDWGESDHKMVNFLLWRWRSNWNDWNFWPESFTSHWSCHNIFRRPQILSQVFCPSWVEVECWHRIFVDVRHRMAWISGYSYWHLFSVRCSLQEQMEQAALAYMDLLEGKDKPVAGSSCECKNRKDL